MIRHVVLSVPYGQGQSVTEKALERGALGAIWNSVKTAASEYDAVSLIIDEEAFQALAGHLDDLKRLLTHQTD